MATTSQYTIENEGPAILGATLTVTIIALITFVTRLYVRIKMIENVGWDDYVMGAAMALCVAGQLIIIPEVHYGAGRHLNQISPKDFQTGFKLNFVSQPIYLFAIMLVKESVGCFLLRIAATPFYRRTIISVMAFMAFYTTACFLTIMLQCTNLAVQWDPNAKGTCWGVVTLKALGYTNVALNITTDILFAIVIPIPMLWNIQINRRQRTSVIGILGLGIFATAAALIKIGSLVNYGKTGDWLWDSRNITIWTVTECNIGIIAGNLPCLKPLFRSILGSTYGRGSRQKTTSKYLPGSYGPGVSHKSVKNYNELGSRRTEEDIEFRAYGLGDAHLMTTIGADKERAGSAASLRDDATPGKSSQESLVGNGGKGGLALFPDVGGIRKTTQVNIFESSEVSSLEEGLKTGRK